MTVSISMRDQNPHADFSLPIDHVPPLTFPFKQHGHLHETKATFRTLSHEQIRVFFVTGQKSEYCN